MDYIFQSAKQEDVNDIFQLYVDRIKWMDMKGLRQWNVTDYLSRYPIAYYREQCESGTLFLLRKVNGNEIVGAVVLLESDIRWLGRNDVPAYYVHNLVTVVTAKGAGRRMLEEAEKMAVKNKKHFIRLDCAIDNQVLNDYYSAIGYEAQGKCEDGPYKGNLRQKSLTVIPQEAD